MSQQDNLEVPTTVHAIVAKEPPEFGKINFSFQSIKIRRTEPGPNEVLVRMLATGICHTDLFVGGCPTGMYGNYPKVLGHEGSGYALAVGSNVTSVAVGDPVLLSYNYCGDCDLCSNGDLTYCQNFALKNADAYDKLWDGEDSGNDGIGGKYFGQSSFASLSFVDEQSVVSVKGLIKDEEELKLLSPLGCGLLTGSGAIINTAGAVSRDVILVTGLGAVGLGAIMAAKLQDCHTIIAVDRIPSRLKLAEELGATHTFNTSDYDLKSESYASDIAEKIKALSDSQRINYALDTTGLLPIINVCLRSLSKRGKLIQIGVPVMQPTHVLGLDMIDFFGGTKRFEINYLGDCKAKEQVPKMIQWFKEGKFPVDKFVKFYDVKDFEQALEDMKGHVVKPVLIH